MISELNAFSNIRSREQCRSIGKHSRYDDDYNYSPDDPWYLDSYSKFDW